MGNSRFQFKQFDIYHDKCSMKVGTDGVLLGAWCNVEDSLRVLDIGTGSGLIAIMIAQRNSYCTVDAVEIDYASWIQASGNMSASPWHKRLKVHNISFQEFFMSSNHTYDLIVSNPPWFQNSLTTPLPERSLARHATSLTMEDIIEGVNKLLSPAGRYCMIMPVDEARLFIEKASKKELHCRKITSVIPNPGKSPKRYLMEFTTFKGDIKMSELVVELDKRHKYSNGFKELTKEFYLYFRY